MSEVTNQLTGGRSSFASSAEQDRIMKARKVMSILQQHVELADKHLLDVGTGAGYMAHEWAQWCGQVSSVDVDDQRSIQDGYTFKRVVDERLPYDLGTFDVVISNQVIEHVWNQDRHIDEICRVLKSGGLAYLSTPNRFCLIEPHHRLPLLAWFGDAFARFYLKAMRGKEWDVKLLSFGALERKLLKHFEVIDAIPSVMTDPIAFYQTTDPLKAKWMARLPGFLWQSKWNPLLPSFMLVLKKKPAQN